MDDNALAVFQAERPRLFRIAHRILSSVPETEDVMQDVWLRWERSACRATVPSIHSTTTNEL